MSQDHLTNRQNEDIIHRRNTNLRHMLASARQIGRSETAQSAVDLNLRQQIDHNIVPINVHHNVGSSSDDNIAAASSISNSSSGILLCPTPQYQMGNNTTSRETMRFPIKRRSSENSEHAVGESSTRRRVPPSEYNPNNNLSMSNTPSEHVNSSTNFNFSGHHGIPHNFQSYEQGGSSSQPFVPHVLVPTQLLHLFNNPTFSEANLMPVANSQIGMGSWTPSDHLMFRSYQNQNANFVYGIHNSNAPSSSYIQNTVNIHQHVRISETSHFVAPSLYNVRRNQPPSVFGSRLCEQSWLLLRRATVNGDNQLILTSTSPEFRFERIRLRDQIYSVQQQLRNSTGSMAEDVNNGSMAEDGVIMRAYSRALIMLDAQERQDQLNSEAWRYAMEGGLDEEEIMELIRHEFFQSSGEEEQHDTCAICQEDYANGEHLGRLDCGHAYHLECIKEWLMQKNSCPVCKQTALNVENWENWEDEGDE